MRNPGVGIGCLPNTKFHCVNIQPLFDDDFLTSINRQQGDKDVKKNTIALQGSKKLSEPTHKILVRQYLQRLN